MHDNIPGEPKTFIFWRYDPYIEGLKPSFFMVLGSKGDYISVLDETCTGDSTTQFYLGSK